MSNQHLVSTLQMSLQAVCLCRGALRPAVFAESPTHLLGIRHQQRAASADERGRSEGKSGMGGLRSQRAGLSPGLIVLVTSAPFCFLIGGGKCSGPR